MRVAVPDAIHRDVKMLAQRRGRFVWPLWVAALGSYALVLLAFAYWPGLVRRQVIGAFNVAYLLAVDKSGQAFQVRAPLEVPTQKAA